MFTVDITATKYLNGVFYDALFAFREILSELNAVAEISESDELVILSVACEHTKKETVVKRVRDFIIEAICEKAKRVYLRNKLKKVLDCFTVSGEILFDSLCVFDGEKDACDVRRNIRICGVVSLDGYFLFRLNRMRERWDDIVRIAKENLALLSCDKSYGLLLRFMLSTAAPRAKLIMVKRQVNGYLIKASGISDSLRIREESEVLRYLIKCAPLRVVCNNFSDKSLKTVINEAFDVNFVENICAFGEKLRQ